MTRRGAQVVAVIVLLAVTVLGAPRSHVAAQETDRSTGAPEDRPAPRVSLVRQSDEVEPDGTFDVFLDVRDAPAGSELAVDLYDRVTDLDQLETALSGEPRRALATYPVVPLSERARSSQTSGFSIQLHRSGEPAPGPSVWSRRLDEPGVYPVRIRLRDADHAEIAQTVTFLHRLPSEPDGEPQLELALVLDLMGGPATLDDETEQAILRLLEVLAEHPDVPVGINLGPERARRLLDDPEIEEQLGELLARDQLELLGSPFVPIDPGRLVAEGFTEDVHSQAMLGRFTLAGLVGRAGSSTWLLRTPVDDEAAAILHRAGVTRTIVTDAVVTVPPTSGPVRLGAGDDVPVAITSGLVELPTAGAGEPDDPELAVVRVMTDALVRSSFSGHRSTSVAVLDPATDPDTLDHLLRRLERHETLVDVHTPADLPIGGELPAAALRPIIVEPSRDYARARRAAEDLQASYRSMLDDRDPDDTFDVEIARSASTELTDGERIDLLDRIRERLETALAGITTSPTERVTLGTRDAHVPVAFTSTASVPLRVRIHLEASDRLEFPQNDMETVLAPEQRTVVQIPVRSRTTGDTPMTLTVTTPDERIIIATGRYTVRSTAVSGVGLVLTVGAAGFLVIWWSRHILRARRLRHEGPDASDADGSPDTGDSADADM